MNERVIGYIENGVVIDHIPVGKVWDIVHLLNIDSLKDPGRISLGDGFESNKIGKKGMLKIEGISLTEYQLNLISLIAENASLSIISNGKIVNKIKTKIPNILKDVIKCPNVNCISNDDHEKVIPIIIYSAEKSIFSCHYCTKDFNKKSLIFK